MKNQAVTSAVLCLLVLVPSRLGAVNKAAIDDRIAKASSCLGEPGPDSKGKEAFQLIMEAVSLAVSATRFSPELAENVEKAKKLFETTSILNPDGIGHLRQAFRLIHGGRDFEVPESVSSTQSAVNYIQRQLAAARKDLGVDRTEECVQKLLETAVLIVTPIQQ